MKDELYAKTEIPYTKVTTIYWQTLSKKFIKWKFEVNILSTVHYKITRFLFLTKVMTLKTKLKNFTNLLSQKL